MTRGWQTGRRFFTQSPHSANTSRKPATFRPMHRKYPILGGLALGLVLFAATAGSAAEYSGASLPGLASLDAPVRPLDGGGRVRIAQSNSGSQAGASSNEDAAAAEAQKKLKKEPSSGDAAAAAAKKKAKKEPSKDDADVVEARKRLKKEIDRARQGSRDAKDEFNPVRRSPRKRSLQRARRRRILSLRSSRSPPSIPTSTASPASSSSCSSAAASPRTAGRKRFTR